MKVFPPFDRKLLAGFGWLSLLLLGIFLPKPLVSQTETAFEGYSKIASQGETPPICRAYIWRNHVRWDSIWQETYTYSPSGLVVETIHDDVFFNPGFAPHYKYLYEYDAQDRKKNWTQKTWGSGTYTNDQRKEWFYSHTGHDSVEYTFQWVSTPFGFDWDTLSGSRTLRTALPNGDILSEEFESWTPTTSGSYWNPQNKVAYHYSQTAEWDTVTYFQAQNGNWLPNGRRVAMNWFDFSQNQCASYVTQLPNGGWSDVQRTTCTFNGLDSDCFTENYSGNWDTLLRQRLLFDSDGRATRVENQIRQANIWSITDARTFDYTLDSLGHVVEMIQQEWDLQFGFQNNLKYVYPSWLVGFAENSQAEMGVTIYPVPATDVCKFRLEGKTGGLVHIELYDLHGRLRVERIRPFTSNEIQLPLSEQLEGGTYLYRITTNAGSARGKIIILR
jgi:hypothetical protein